MRTGRVHSSFLAMVRHSAKVRLWGPVRTGKLGSGCGFWRLRPTHMVRKKLGFLRGSPLCGGEGGLPQEGRHNDPQDPAVAEPEGSQRWVDILHAIRDSRARKAHSKGTDSSSQTAPAFVRPGH